MPKNTKQNKDVGANSSEQSQSLTVIKKEADALITAASELPITDGLSMIQGTSLLSRMNKVADRIKAEKEKITKPLNEALKAERARWKPIEDIYGEAIATLRERMTTYQTAEQARVDAEAAAIAARVKSGKGNLSVDTAVARIDEIDKPAANIATDAGSVGFRPVQCFEVEDLSKIPLAYHLPNEVKIREAMKNGQQFPGVRYWTEQRPINSRN